jgi:hypothetical protein
MSVQRSFSQNRLLKLGFFLGFHLVQIEQESCSPLEKEGSQSARTEKFFCVNAQQQNSELLSVRRGPNLLRASKKVEPF